MSFIFDKLAPLNIWFKRYFKSRFSPFQSKNQSQKCQKRGIFLILNFGRQANGGGGQKPPPPALPWLRYSHRMSKNYLHRTLIFLLPKVYFVQVFIQHTVTNNVIKLHSRRHFYLMFYQIDTFFVRNCITVLREV